MTASERPTYYEFFAGGGMARCGLGDGWDCLFANDFDAQKAKSYSANWGAEHLHVGDVGALQADVLPGRADLAWASSPCQDLSLAGRRAGLSGARSSAFWGFWSLVEGLNRQGRAPTTIVVENVSGLLTSHGGADFRALCAALAAEGYGFGALEIDAQHFLPQSRPRLFIVATRAAPSPALIGKGPCAPFHGRKTIEAHAALPAELKARWFWWRLDPPARRNLDLVDLLEPDEAVAWHSAAATRRLIELMGPLHQAKLDEAKAAQARRVGALFRRTRVEDGQRRQRAELRFDGLAGCLRTPGGGSSRQILVVVDGERVRSRTLTAREGARLMGLPDSYRLPDGATHGLHLVGDGVAAPVARFLAERLLTPLVRPLSRLAAE